MPLYDIFQKAEDEEDEKGKVSKETQRTCIVDNHEKNSLVISELINSGIQVDFEHLEVADFLVNNIAIERKTISDFLSSMISKRLSQQLINLDKYEKRLLIIEGIEEQELYSEKKYEKDKGINSNAIRGFLLDIILKYNVPIIFTKNYEDTAKFLIVLAKKQEKSNDSMRVKRKTRNKREQLQFILEGFPGIGAETAKKLLGKFGTIKNIINSSDKELGKEIGKKAEVFKLTEEKY